MGADRIDEQQRLQEILQRKPLPEQTRGQPAESKAPEIACVMCAGGRYQLLDRGVGARRASPARRAEHRRESRIGLSANMRGQRYVCDPQPTLPLELRHEAMPEKFSEIGKTAPSSLRRRPAAKRRRTLLPRRMVSWGRDWRVMKGTEEYWSSFGGEAISRLRGESQSDAKPVATCWHHCSRHATGSRARRSAERMCG